MAVVAVAAVVAKPLFLHTMLARWAVSPEPHPLMLRLREQRLALLMVTLAELAHLASLALAVVAVVQMPQQPELAARAVSPAVVEVAADRPSLVAQRGLAVLAVLAL